MKKIITLIAAAVMMTVATNSFAQMSVGAGYLHSNDQVTLKGIDPIDVGMNGAYAGVSYNLPIAGIFGITPGIYYSMIYTNDSAFSGQIGTKIREHYINIPAYLNLGFQIAGIRNIQPQNNEKDNHPGSVGHHAGLLPERISAEQDLIERNLEP